MARIAGEGEVRQRKDKYWTWKSTITLATGEKKKINVVRKNRQDVVEEKNKILGEAAQGKTVVKNNITLGIWIKTWLNNYKVGNIEETTWGTYESLNKNHIEKNIGNLLLQRLTTDDIQKFVAKLASKAYSTSTIKQIHSIIHSALTQAILNGYLAINVADHVKLPKTKTKKIKPLTPEDILKLIKAATEDKSIYKERFLTALLLMIEAGLRRGELLGLQWEYVDTENKTIRIEEQITKAPNSAKVLPKEVKSKSSRRTIPLDNDYLWERIGQLPKISKYIFCTKNGTPLNPRNWNRSFDRWCENAGIDYTSHDLRHTFATDMINLGIDYKTVQSLTGHSTSRMLLDNYAHIVTDSQRKAMEKRKGNKEDVKGDIEVKKDIDGNIEQ